MAFASALPYREGMPGPSKMWSTISDSREGALRHMDSPELMTLVLERLDESLIVARHYLGWNLGDVVHVKARKALSSHPKAKDWPSAAVTRLKKAVDERGETAIYTKANSRLDERIKALTASGVDLMAEVTLLQQLRARAQEVCFTESRLGSYKKHFHKLGIMPHAKATGNNLKDVEDDFNMYAFSLNKAIVYSFDVCGGCEAGAMELSMNLGRTKDVASAELLAQLPWELVRKVPALLRCPHPGNIDLATMPILSGETEEEKGLRKVRKH